MVSPSDFDTTPSPIEFIQLTEPTQKTPEASKSPACTRTFIPEKPTKSIQTDSTNDSKQQTLELELSNLKINLETEKHKNKQLETDKTVLMAKVDSLKTENSIFRTKLEKLQNYAKLKLKNSIKTRNRLREFQEKTVKAETGSVKVETGSVSNDKIILKITAKKTPETKVKDRKNLLNEIIYKKINKK